MHLRRFTRLTNALSKKLGNLKAAVTLYFAWYNFCRVHQTLRVTPVMEAELGDHIWEIGELLCSLGMFPQWNAGRIFLSQVTGIRMIPP